MSVDPLSAQVVIQKEKCFSHFYHNKNFVGLISSFVRNDKLSCREGNPGTRPWVEANQVSLNKSY